MKPITYEQALHRLAAHCSRVERCSSDLRKKMTDWELSSSDQEKIIQRLQKEGFLNDERFCRAFVKDKFRYNKWGVHKIAYELKRKQLPENLIQEALQSIDSQEKEEQLKQLLAQKRKTVKGANDYEINQKLIRFAVGRGFGLDEIYRVLS
ncbi:MAG: RecX family transcriptional regulator [Candidatus Symbiothrix sp.]|jgi:regulatory protein|nr:RecX family transcriptional regulator [Candidatus Symbiothrix sp.]